ARKDQDEIRKLGGDITGISAQIDAADKAQRARVEADNAFQQTVQRAQDAQRSGDKSKLEASQRELQAIAQAGGPHASDASAALTQLNQKLASLEAPPPVAPPPATKETPPPTKETSPPVASSESGAIKAVLQRYAEAFEQRDPDALRRIWPSLGKRYSGYKRSFDMASSIRLRVEPGEVTIAPDGSRATAEAVVTQDYTPKGQKTLSNKTRSLFQFSKANGNWVI